CIASKCGGKPDLNATFNATANLKVPTVTSQTITQAIAVGLLFHKWDHVVVDVTSFPNIVKPVPDQPDTVTVSWKSGGNGTYDPASKQLHLSITLHLHHSFAFAGDSDITFNLSSTNPGGSPLDATGANAVAVAGNAT